MLHLQITYCFILLCLKFYTYENLYLTERLLAAQNPLSQADRPHTLFADAPPPPQQQPVPPAPPPPPGGVPGMPGAPPPPPTSGKNKQPVFTYFLSLKHP